MPGGGASRKTLFPSPPSPTPPTWGSTGTPPPRVRGVAGAAAGGRDRPLPVPLARREHAGGGDLADDGGAGGRGEGPLHRGQQLRRPADPPLPGRAACGFTAAASLAAGARR